jgi:hypothetical protein
MIESTSQHEPAALLRFAERFRGPPGMANGGFVAGTLAHSPHRVATITLQRPVPLERALRVAANGDGAALYDEDVLIATRENAELELELPAPCSLEAAERARARFTGANVHPFPGCFVCGPARASGDALRLLTGPTETPDTVAAPWVPEPLLCEELGGSSSEVPVPLVWAALDCPGAWSILSSPAVDVRAIVLGRITARVLSLPRAGEAHVVMGYRVGQERRKHYCRTAIFDARGRACAYAESTWIAVG